jgi:hypothetical protein
MSTPVSAPRLLGRRNECAALDELVASVRTGASRALVLRGEAGVGKSALLEYLMQHASGCGIARATGIELEMELAYAGLQQLCAPFLDRLKRLPGPQHDALGTAFGLRDGDAPDRFIIGLAVLSLLSDVAEERPLVCIVDDAQWLDAASAQALAFVARRLGAESAGLVFAVREPSDERHFEGLPELAVGGLDDRDALELLGTVVAGPLDERVRDRIVAETRGNPLALLELPRLRRTLAELAGGFGLSDGVALSGRIEQSFTERLAALPPPTRLLLLVAAAEPVGDPVLVWRAAAQLGIGPDAAAPATGVGLIDFGAQGASVIRLCVRRSRLRPRRRSASASTALLPRPPMPMSIRIAAPGTLRTRQPGSTRTSPPSWSARRDEHGHAVAWRRGRHFMSAPSSSHLIRNAGHSARSSPQKASTRPARTRRRCGCWRSRRRGRWTSSTRPGPSCCTRRSASR